jgi:hypothetical protein
MKARHQASKMSIIKIVLGCRILASSSRSIFQHGELGIEPLEFCHGTRELEEGTARRTRAFKRLQR